MIPIPVGPLVVGKDGRGDRIGLVARVYRDGIARSDSGRSYVRARFTENCRGGVLKEPAIFLTMTAIGQVQGLSSVESRCGAVAVGERCLLPPLSSGGARVLSP